MTERSCWRRLPRMFCPLWLSCLITLSGHLSAESLRFFTEHSPPGEYLAPDGQVKGPTVELIRILQQRLQDEGPIEIYPWARAVQLASQHAGSVLFETVRNDLREDKYQWVGPLKIHDITLYGRSSAAAGQSRSGKRLIACDYRDSAVLGQIRQLGYQENRNLIVTTQAGECNELLLKGRVDLVALNQLVMPLVNQQLARQNDSLRAIQSLSAARLYLAFSLKIAPERVSRWQQALLQTYRDGTMRQLYQSTYSEQMIRQLEQLAATQELPQAVPGTAGK